MRFIAGPSDFWLFDCRILMRMNGRSNEMPALPLDSTQSLLFEGVCEFEGARGNGSR